MRHFGFAIAAALAFSSAAQARDYSALVTFGDSLVDSGNVRIAALAAGQADPAPPAQGYFDGRFSNGFNWADWFSIGLFGMPQSPVLAGGGGTNFAFGGARAADNVDFVPDIQAQAGLFELLSGGVADPNALYFINAGGNDGFAQAFGAPDAPTAAASAAAIAGTVQTLAGLGARYFVVSNVVDLGPVPLVVAAGASAQATAASLALNAAIDAALDSLVLGPDAQLFRFDAFSLARRVLTDPAAFGLPGLNVTTPCTFIPGAAPECTGLAYFDAVHPTTAVGEIFGRGLLQSVPVPATLALFGLGLLGLATRWSRN